MIWFMFSRVNKQLLTRNWLAIDRMLLSVSEEVLPKKMLQ